MNAVAWTIALFVARALERDERDAVCGDLIESRTDGTRALLSIAGLVLRRQSTAWLDWHPWLALVTIAIPAGIMLSHVSRTWADSHAIYAYLYINRWSPAYFENPGSRREMLSLAVLFVLHMATIAAWSWTAGRALGALSRKTAWVTTAIFCVLVAGATIGSTETARDHNSRVFATHFYDVVFPRLIRLLCVIVPAVWGVSRSRRHPSLRSSLLIAASIIAVTAVSARRIEASFTFGRNAFPADAGPDRMTGTADDPRPLRPLPFAIVWPACCLVATSLSARRRTRRATMTVLAVIVALPSAALAQAGGADYTQWRGALRDGSASAFRPPAAWPQSLTRRWTVDVGEGYATPLVVGNAAFVFSRRNGREVITALDISTGAIRWQSGYTAAFTPSAPIAVHGAGPKATPVYAGGRLFTQGISGIVSAFDATTGTLLWQTAEPAEHPFFSAAVSPLVEGELVIVHPGNYGPLTAFDTRTGKVAWTVGGGGYFASPIAVDIGGARQIVSVTQDAILGVSPRGELLWRHPWAGGNGSTTPVLNDGLIIVSDGTQVVGLRAGRRDGQWLVERVWTTTDASMYISNPVVVSDVLYGMSTKQRRQFFALDAKTGATLWLGAPGVATNTAIVKAGELLFLLKDDAELIVARASRQAFQPIARYTVAASATWAQPAISGNRILVKDVGSLTLWTVD